MNSASPDIHSDSKEPSDSGRVIPASDDPLLSNLNAVRLITVVIIGIGYASTMPIGPGAREWLNLFGYDASLYGLQILFFLSGWLAWRSLSQGRTGLAFLQSRVLRNWPWVILYTALVAFLLYPALCDPNASTVETTGDLLLYFVKTITFIQPGPPMPGALDSAPYACLLQGTIWTFRWGVIAYALLLILYALRLRQRALYGLGLILLITAHIALNSWTDRTGSDAFAGILPGLRLGMAFCFGLVIRQNMSWLPKKAQGWVILSAILLGIAALNYYSLTWSYGIELFATAGMSAFAMALLHSRWAVFKGWVDFITPTYLGVWPITQMWLAFLPDLSVMQLVILSVLSSMFFALILVLLGRATLRVVHRRVQTA